MMNIETFILKNNVSKSQNLASENIIKEAETKVGILFGRELTEYLLKYGYLAFEFVELYGINALQGLNSDMVKQTVYLHQYYPETVNYVALENCGEGDYRLVGSKDEVYEYDSNLKQLTNTGLSLFEYILQRFQSLRN